MTDDQLRAKILVIMMITGFFCLLYGQLFRSADQMEIWAGEITRISKVKDLIEEIQPLVADQISLIEASVLAEQNGPLLTGKIKTLREGIRTKMESMRLASRDPPGYADHRRAYDNPQRIYEFCTGYGALGRLCD